MLPLLLVPIVLAAGLMLLGESINKDFVEGIFFFILAACIPVVIVGANTVVVDDANNKVLAYLFGIKMIELTRGSVRDIHEGYLFPVFPGGAGFGKGIIVRAIYKGKVRILRMGSGLYGKDAVEHVVKVLRNNL